MRPRCFYINETETHSEAALATWALNSATVVLFLIRLKAMTKLLIPLSSIVLFEYRASAEALRNLKKIRYERKNGPKVQSVIDIPVVTRMIFL